MRNKTDTLRSHSNSRPRIGRYKCPDHSSSFHKEVTSRDGFIDHTGELRLASLILGFSSFFLPFQSILK